MGINSRFKFAYRSNASKGHTAVGEILRNSNLFKNYPHYQEWPVSKIDPNWHSNREHFDWVIPMLKLVIEYHGIQHIKQNSFFHASVEEFEEQKARDERKKQAAISNGWTYIAITPDIKITDKWIYEEYKKNFNSIKIHEEVKQPSDKDLLLKAKASEYRKKRYREQKEWLDKKHGKIH